MIDATGLTFLILYQLSGIAVGFPLSENPAITFRVKFAAKPVIAIGVSAREYIRLRRRSAINVTARVDVNYVKAEAISRSKTAIELKLTEYQFN